MVAIRVRSAVGLKMTLARIPKINSRKNAVRRMPSTDLNKPKQRVMIHVPEQNNSMTAGRINGMK